MITQTKELRAFLEDITSSNYSFTHHGGLGFSVGYKDSLIARTHFDDGRFMVELDGSCEHDGAVQTVVRACRTHKVDHLVTYAF